MRKPIFLIHVSGGTVKYYSKCVTGSLETPILPKPKNLPVASEDAKNLRITSCLGKFLTKLNSFRIGIKLPICCSFFLPSN